MHTLKTISQQLGCNPQITRKHRDRGFFHKSHLIGRVSQFDDPALAKAAVASSLFQSGMEGPALESAMRCLENVNADMPKGASHKIGFAHVLDEIKSGEQWDFRFYRSALGDFSGSCQPKSSSIENPLVGPVETRVDLNAVCNSLKFIDD